ncbi:MAG TPA: sigma 54-interacting transcriptional regulator, partial [Polyangiaceae bacterium]|nr:sigma 54-interacting transcriptional regulator [Polyangiaceae bacterium]
VVNTGSRSEVYPLFDDTVVSVGRDGDNLIRIEDSSVSRHHLELHATEDGAFVVDLDSSNGTLLMRGSAAGDEESGPGTAHRLPPHQPVPLRVGQSVRVGPALIVLQIKTRTSQSQLAAGRAGTPPVLVDPEMRRVYDLLSRAAQSEVSVLIFGETGVGKEMMAETVHRRSRRAHRPYLQLNCAALPESLLESELFGHEKGAFTGAHASKVGLLESTDGGTVFLDEIGELGLGTQAKLLRVLEERTLLRVGGTKPRRISVRFVTATNRDLVRECRDGRFRSDLYYRISGLVVRIPPLRQRLGEIEPLSRHFLSMFCQALEQPEPPLADATLELLSSYDWPGNVRELRNVIERAALVAGREPIRPEHVMLDPPISAGRRSAPPDAQTQVISRAPVSTLPRSSGASMVPSGGRPPRSSRRSSAPASVRTSATPPDGAALEEERTRLIAALDSCAGNQTRAAQMLGISRRQLISRIEFWQLPRPKKR